MSTLFASDTARRAWSAAWWLLPALALGLLIAWEIDWGRQLFRAPPPPPPVVPAPVGAAVLPDYRIEGGLVARSETGSRTLFNPTRRPAATLASEGGGPGRIHTGQFVLVGTTVSGDEKTAFLKEAVGGKGRIVHQGDEINGMKVALVAADRVKLTAGGDAEELLLKVVKGPKTTIGVPPPPPAAATAGQPAPLPQSVPAQAVAARPATAAETAAVARSARRAAAGGAPGSPAPGAAAAPAGAGDSAPPPGSWAATFQNMQQQGAQQQQQQQQHQQQQPPQQQ